MRPRVQLPSRRAEDSAAEDGALLWDRAQGAVVVTRAGDFPALGVRVAAPPTSASAGLAGDWAADASWLYVCIAPNAWRRVALTTF